MDRGTIAAIFICILGCVLILAAVFLSYKWRYAKPAPKVPMTPETPASTETRYKIRRGRRVLQSDRDSIVSTHSEWTSLGTLSLLFSRRPTEASVEAPRKGSAGSFWWQRRVHDLEAAAHLGHGEPEMLEVPPERPARESRTSMLSTNWLHKWPKQTIFEDVEWSPRSPRSPATPKSPSLSPHPLRQHKPTTSPFRKSFAFPPPAHHNEGSRRVEVARVVRFVRPNFGGSSK